MRIVLDTNVLARALSGPRGPAGEVVRLAGPPHVLLLSPPILSELSRVLAYERIQRVHGLSEEAVNRYLNGLQSAALIVDVYAPLHQAVVSHDADDDFVIATAIAGNAAVICTRDRHFFAPDVLAFCTEHNIQIMGDVELLRMLRAQQNA
jgi:putative PIN family toxin of toxin-antitoxin system